MAHAAGRAHDWRMRKMPVATPGDQDDATLSSALHSLALSQLPSRFYLSLQLALPAAAQAWVWGWPRIAAVLVVASAFGIWALSEQSLEQGGDESMGNGQPTRVLRGVHWIAGVVAGGMSAALVLDLMLRFFGVVFRCPGCAG